MSVRCLFVCLLVLVIDNATAQYRTTELKPQSIKQLQNQNVRELRSVVMPAPRMKLVSQRHRYVIKKAPKMKNNLPNISKRQYLAELLKQSAYKNVHEAASICNREKKSPNIKNFFEKSPLNLFSDGASANNGVLNFKYL
ncbi:unnamed protein product [Colias eurytheme]|nr:unnamed protein product [Colias eurytheme]